MASTSYSELILEIQIIVSFILWPIKTSKRNRVFKLQDANGSWINTSYPELNNAMKNPFEDLFSCSRTRDFTHLISLVPNLISKNMNQALCVEISEDETLNVKQIGPLKAPGQDGFPGYFFRKYWDIVGEQVCLAVKEFFRTNSLSPTLSVTQVVLIPKVSNPENLGQFRPISLCNFVYRFISKVLENRLKPHMKNLISPQQSAFILGKLIQCIMVARESFHHISHKKKGSIAEMAMKLDLNKDFDHAECDFQLVVMNKWISALGGNLGFINVSQLLLSSSWSMMSILLNKFSKRFKTERSVISLSFPFGS